jgi:hypothetical protein
VIIPDRSIRGAGTCSIRHNLHGGSVVDSNGIGGGAGKNAKISQLQTLPIGVSNYMVDCSGVKISLLNNRPDTVRINSIVIDDTSCSPFSSFALTIGQRKTVECPNIYEAQENKNFELSCVINYTDVKTGASYTQSGNEFFLVGRSGSCAGGGGALVAGALSGAGSDSATNGSITIGMEFSTT